MEKKYMVIETLLIAFLGVITAAVTILVIKYAGASPKDAANMRVDTRSEGAALSAAEEDLLGRSIFFAGIEDTTVKKGTRILLENLEENGDFLMRYRIYDEEDEKMLFETDLIPAGEHVAWIPSEFFTSGAHTVAFVEEPYFMKDGEYIPLTSGRNVVNIEILED